MVSINTSYKMDREIRLCLFDVDIVKDERHFVVSKYKSTSYLIICLKAIEESHKAIPTNDDDSQLLYSCGDFFWK